MQEISVQRYAPTFLTIPQVERREPIHSATRTLPKVECSHQGATSHTEHLTVPSSSDPLLFFDSMHKHASDDRLASHLRYSPFISKREYMRAGKVSMSPYTTPKVAQVSTWTYLSLPFLTTTEKTAMTRSGRDEWSYAHGRIPAENLWKQPAKRLPWTGKRHIPHHEAHADVPCGISELVVFSRKDNVFYNISSRWCRLGSCNLTKTIS